MLQGRAALLVFTLLASLIIPTSIVSAQQSAPASSPPPAEDAAKAEALRKAAQNPVASLISVPLQDNINPGFEPGYRTQNVLNIQPVIPVKLNEDWNVIIRWITPIIYQPITPTPGAPELGASGLGDMQPTFLFSPRKPHKITWGAGPILQLPTATSDYLGQGKLGIGPNVVVLAMPRKFVMGVLINNIWSVSSNKQGGAYNNFLLQPFINYNFPGGLYLTTAPIVTADWKADSSQRWTVPLGGGIGKIFHLGKLPVNTQLSAYYNVVKPDNGANWQIRVQAQFMFPK